ncbi:hypothetical protein BT69DRAFT_1344304 [Atractiella rhizophila]|nr:hypothetical protein BT69DRAFT_1344304 [Atractiella rhizophila]
MSLRIRLNVCYDQDFTFIPRKFFTAEQEAELAPYEEQLRSGAMDTSYDMPDSDVGSVDVENSNAEESEESEMEGIEEEESEDGDEDVDMEDMSGGSGRDRGAGGTSPVSRERAKQQDDARRNRFQRELTVLVSGRTVVGNDSDVQGPRDSEYLGSVISSEDEL